MASVTSWTRLEPRTRDERLTSVQARVADPLWLVGRQWQIGELQGEDAGSPILAELDLTVSRISRWAPSAPVATADPLPPDMPLDVLVEAERASVPGGGLRAALDAGCGCSTCLAPGPQTTPPRSPPRTARCRRTPPNRQTPRRPGCARLPPAGFPTPADCGLRSGPGGRAGDPRRPSSTPPTSRSSTPFDTWLRWYASRATPTIPPAAWRPERLEHEFSVAARTTGPGPIPASAETVLVATDYGTRYLDWHAMDVWAGQTLGALADPAPQLTTVTTLPTRVTFPGMPVARWWQFEEGDVDLTALSPAPQDLGRILFTEFALNYGNDFFWLPIDLPVGSVTKVESLRVTTSFGDVVEVPTTAAADLAARRRFTDGRAAWAMFAPTVLDAGVEAGAADLLVLLPVGTPPLHGEPLEEILLSRDEMANVAWALEMTVPGPSGAPLDRHELWQRSRPDPEPPPGVPHRPSLAYELATTLPPYWLPLLNRPGPAGSNRSVLLGLEALTPPLGTLLHNGFALHEERLTRTGIRLLRHRRRTRATDGRVHTWTARRSGPGQGESTSGLHFDSLRGELRGKAVDDGEIRPWRPRSEWRAARRAGTCRPSPSSRTPCRSTGKSR